MRELVFRRDQEIIPVDIIIKLVCLSFDLASEILAGRYGAGQEKRRVDGGDLALALALAVGVDEVVEEPGDAVVAGVRRLSGLDREARVEYAVRAPARKRGRDEPARRRAVPLGGDRERGEAEARRCDARVLLVRAVLHQAVRESFAVEVVRRARFGLVEQLRVGHGGRRCGARGDGDADGLGVERGAVGGDEGEEVVVFHVTAVRLPAEISGGGVYLTAGNLSVLVVNNRDNCEDVQRRNVSVVRHIHLRVPPLVVGIDRDTAGVVDYLDYLQNIQRSNMPVMVKVARLPDAVLNRVPVWILGRRDKRDNISLGYRLIAYRV